MLTTALSLPISQYHCVTMAAISGIYSKRVYSNKLQQHLLAPKFSFSPLALFWPFSRMDLATCKN